MTFESDTIAAIATPEGEGGISVIRVSGEKSFDVIARGFRGAITPDKMSSHSAHYGRFVDASGDKIDEVLVLVFERPNSYTGEDTVEVSCHGGRLVTKKILGAILGFGARAAVAGEFTKRAFLNGRIDLAQAEAVADLIHSRTERAHRSSLSQLEGDLSKKIVSLRELLIDTVGLLELELDFAEEGYDFTGKSRVISQLGGAATQIDGLLSTYSVGRIFREGVKVAIAGAPNVGKSSLLNALLQEDRAIVTEIPGTTRDVIEESISLEGLLFDISDTAGLRETVDLVEREGVKRAEERFSSSDIIVITLDITREVVKEEAESIERIKKSANSRGASFIFALNKVDALTGNEEWRKRIGSLTDGYEVVLLSARTHEGLGLLKDALVRNALHGAGVSSEGGVIITSARHFSALKRAKDSLDLAMQTVQSGGSGEFVAVDLRAGLDTLGEIIGMVSTDDILNSIFSRFCIGK
jgi:tRNA modification GTPase